MTETQDKANRIQGGVSLAIVAALVAMLVAIIVVVNDSRRSLPDAAIVSQLTKRDCPYGLASSYSNDLKIRCYSFAATAGLEESNNTAFILPLAVISPRKYKQHVNNSPVVLIPGGPGEGKQTQMQSLSYWAERARESGLDRDLVLYDPRGVGDSQPAWDCEAFNQFAIDILPQNMSFAEELRLSGEVLSDCVNAMADFYRQISPNALAVFSSRFQALDVSQMMRALGYERWHLWGISYGTRVALLAGADPAVDSLVLDSVYPPGRGSADGWGMLQEHAMALHRVHYQKFIGAKSGQERVFDTHWSTALKAIPKDGLYGTFSTWGEQASSHRLALNDHRLYSLLFYVLYDAGLLPAFYRGVQALGDSANPQSIPIDLTVPLESFLTSGLDARFNAMVYFATECSDNAKVDEHTFRRSVEQVAVPTQIAQWLQIEWENDICRHSAFNDGKPLSSLVPTDKPMLILSGQIDPITPSSYAQEVYGVFEHSAVVNFPGSGHALSNSQDCALDLILDFMQHGMITEPTCNDAHVTTKIEQSDSVRNSAAIPSLHSPRNLSHISAHNLRAKLTPNLKTTPINQEDLSMSNPIWIDVRTAEEYADGHYPDSINIPYDIISDHIEAVSADKDATIFVYCRSGKRSGVARDTLSAMGYSQVENKGGLSDVMPNH